MGFSLFVVMRKSWRVLSFFSSPTNCEEFPLRSRQRYEVMKVPRGVVGASLDGVERGEIGGLTTATGLCVGEKTIPANQDAKKIFPKKKKSSSSLQSHFRSPSRDIFNQDPLPLSHVDVWGPSLPMFVSLWRVFLGRRGVFLWKKKKKV